jgi:hypothetical protein
MTRVRFLFLWCFAAIVGLACFVLSTTSCTTSEEIPDAACIPDASSDGAVGFYHDHGTHPGCCRVQAISCDEGSGVSRPLKNPAFNCDAGDICMLGDHWYCLPPGEPFADFATGEGYNKYDPPTRCDRERGVWYYGGAEVASCANNQICGLKGRLDASAAHCPGIYEVPCIAHRYDHYECCDPANDCECCDPSSGRNCFDSDMGP